LHSTTFVGLSESWSTYFREGDASPT
jgi:hypothetical protein